MAYGGSDTRISVYMVPPPEPSVTTLAREKLEPEISELNLEGIGDYQDDSRASKQLKYGLSRTSVVPKATEDVIVTPKYTLTPNDTNDPSYTNLTLPYSVICRQRYHKACAKQKAQFIKECKVHELLRDRALDGVRIHREFCHVIINQVQPSELITLTRKQQDRLERLLKEP